MSSESEALAAELKMRRDSRDCSAMDAIKSSREYEYVQKQKEELKMIQARVGTPDQHEGDKSRAEELKRRIAEMTKDSLEANSAVPAGGKKAKDITTKEIRETYGSEEEYRAYKEGEKAPEGAKNPYDRGSIKALAWKQGNKGLPY